MSLPALNTPSSLEAEATRASARPYAVPQHATATVQGPARVGPYVPLGWRGSALGTAGHAADAATVVAASTNATPEWPVPAAQTPAMPTPVAVTPALEAQVEEAPRLEQGPAADMVIPASIPPYRPLRPTPIITPAIRTPLYIPPIPTPAAEAAVEDEGVIDPLLVDTAEFAIPSMVAHSNELYPAEAHTRGGELVADLEASAANDADMLESEFAEPVQELPWIDAFLAATPALAQPAIPTPSTELSTVDALWTSGAEADTQAEAEVEAAAEAEVDADVEVEAQRDATFDAWPLEEAAAEFRALRSSVPEPVPETDSVSDAVTNEGADGHRLPAAMTPWSDDDMMDIMPIRHSGKTPLSNAVILPDSELWAERARTAHEAASVEARDAAIEQVPSAEPVPEATAEEAAHALELLARRVRAGELTLPSYDPRMGEPAALVAALAALLGVRLR